MNLHIEKKYYRCEKNSYEKYIYICAKSGIGMNLNQKKTIPVFRKHT